MLRKLTKLITNNFGLKVLGAVFAVVLWLVVVNVEDPNKTVSFSAPVKIDRTAYLTDMGKTYEVLDNTDIITFSVTGRRSVVEKLSASDFNVVANMENIDDTMSMIPISVTLQQRVANDIEIRKKSSHVLVRVENLVSKSFNIEVLTVGKPSTYCFIEDTALSPRKVTVSGPESAVSNIDKAQIMIGVEGATEDVVENSEIRLLNANGAEVDRSRLELNRTEVAVDVRILMKKTVPLKLETTGEPQVGYRYLNMESDVEQVTLVGYSDAMSEIKELVISDSRLDLSRRTESYSLQIHLADQLPNHVYLAEGEPTDVNVSVQLEARSSREFNVPVSNLTVKGLESGLDLEYRTDTVKVKIYGFNEDLDRISAGALFGTVDVTGMSVGNHTVRVSLDGEFANDAEALVSVKISSADGDNADDNS